ncbi:transcriptional repressor LexA [Elusimicrobiota bacterium]
MEKLTEKQKKVLDFAKDFNSENGFMPTVRDIAKSFTMSIGAVQDHMKALIKKGHLNHTPGVSRGIELASRKPTVSIPILGRVHAGNLSEAIEHVEDYICVDKDIARTGDYFALKVQGDSMTGSGIYEDDLIVVKKQSAAEDGDIVVAMVDGEAAVKKLRKIGTQVYLQSTNPRYKPIYANEIIVLGKVVYLSRSL